MVGWRQRPRHGYPRRNKSANGTANDGHIAQIKLIDKRNIYVGERTNTVYPVWAVSAAETGVSRDHDMNIFAGGEPLSKSRHRLRSCAAVQQQKWMTATVLVNSNFDLFVGGRLDGINTQCDTSFSCPVTA